MRFENPKSNRHQSGNEVFALLLVSMDSSGIFGTCLQKKEEVFMEAIILKVLTRFPNYQYQTKYTVDDMLKRNQILNGQFIVNAFILDGQTHTNFIEMDLDIITLRLLHVRYQLLSWEYYQENMSMKIT